MDQIDAKGSDNQDNDASKLDVTSEEQTMFDAIIAQTQAITEQLQHARMKQSEMVFEGSAAVGAVCVQVSGDMEFSRIQIDPAIVEKDDVALLEDAVLAAVRDGVRKVKTSYAESMGSILG